MLLKRCFSKKGKRSLFVELFGSKFYSFKLDDWVYTEDAAKDRLLRHFETVSLKGFGVHTLELGIIASGAILHYLDLTQHTQIQHISGLSRIEEERYVWLDRFTIRNLELFNSLNEGAKTLIQVIDKTITPMGARLLKRWVALPLKDIPRINDRLDVVQKFVENAELKEGIEAQLRQIGDLERLISKAAVGRMNPREMVQLKTALFAIEPVKELCANSTIRY